MTTPDVNVVPLDFHDTVDRESVAENEDGSYTIFINTRMNYETQMAAYQHAMRHIHDKDFQKKNVQNIEAVAHDLNIPVPRDDEKIPSKEYLAKIRKLRRERERIQRKLESVQSEIDVMRSMGDVGAWQWFG